jgi:hypothetical protein
MALSVGSIIKSTINTRKIVTIINGMTLGGGKEPTIIYINSVSLCVCVSVFDE